MYSLLNVTFESVALLNEMFSSFVVNNDLLDSSNGNGVNLPTVPITSHAAPTIKGLVSSSNATKKLNTLKLQNDNEIYISN